MLADALAYAVDELDPDALVDIATLTGAMKVALGQQTGGYFANDDGLADQLRGRRGRVGRAALADAAGRRLRGASWPPRSPTPTTPPGGAGAITAALFLQHFAGDVPWAHLDIASVGGRRRPTATSGPPAPPASVPGCCSSWLGSDRPAGRDRD